MHKPTFRQLQIFEAVARHKNVTRAAEELFMTQSSVSTQLKQLKNHIGHALYEQKGKQIIITPVGETVVDLHQEMDKSWRQFSDKMSQLGDGTRGEINVSCVNTCQYFFPKLIGLFNTRFPEIQIRFRVYNRQEVMSRIVRNADDIYMMDYISEDLDVKAVPFIDNPLVIVSHPTHHLANEKNIALEKLECERFLVREPGSGTRREADLFFHAYGIDIKSQMEMGSNEAIKQGIMAGMGIGVLSHYAVSLELNLGLLISLDTQGFPLMRKWNIAYPSWKEITPVVRTFLDYLKGEGRSVVLSAIDSNQICYSADVNESQSLKTVTTPS